VSLVIHTIGEDFRGTKNNVDEKAPWSIAIDNQRNGLLFTGDQTTAP